MLILYIIQRVRLFPRVLLFMLMESFSDQCGFNHVIACAATEAIRVSVGQVADLAGIRTAGADAEVIPDLRRLAAPLDIHRTGGVEADRRGVGERHEQHRHRCG